MAMMLPKKKATLVKTRVHAKADKFGYSTYSRTENNQSSADTIEEAYRTQ